VTVCGEGSICMFFSTAHVFFSQMGAPACGSQKVPLRGMSGSYCTAMEDGLTVDGAGTARLWGTGSRWTELALHGSGGRARGE